MARTRTLLHGEPDPHVRDGSRVEAAEREARLRHELAQLKPGGWQRGAPVPKGTRLEAPPPPRETDPPTLRSVLPPAAPATLRGGPLEREPETLRVVVSGAESAPATIPPLPPRSPRRRVGSRDAAVLAGGAAGAAVLVGLGLWLSRKTKSTKPPTSPARRADTMPARPGRAAPVPPPTRKPAPPGRTSPSRPVIAPRKAKR